jgi:hypothetical protein
VSASGDASGGEAKADDEYFALFLDLVSIRVGSYRIRGSDADADSWGFLFALDPDVVTTDGYFSKRSTWFAAIGGGSDGLEGQLESSSRAGVRGYFGRDHGPFARAGLGFQFLGNNKLYRSQFELPQMDVGYQLMNDTVLVEVAATASLVLGGRYYTGDHAERRIDTEPSVGGLLTVQADPVRLHVTAQRIFAAQTGPGTPIDQAQAQLCATIISPVFVCAHAGYHRGDVELPTGGFRESTVRYFGGTLGVGFIKNDGGSF